MERLTEIKTHVTGFSYTDKKEGIFAQNVYAKLAAYEDTGLTPEEIKAQQQEIEQLKEQINTAKIGWDTYKTYSEQLEQQTAESNKIIETQRQEIEKLKATLADWKYNAKCDAEQMKYLLRRTLPILEVRNDQQGLIDAINALLGGKEDA